jgi:2-dehydropantoate 2-reductase
MALSFSIIGTGALGGYYGALLHHAGFETHFLLHNDYAHVRACGLRVESIHGDLSIAQGNFWPDLSTLPACDVVCICLKSTANAQLREALASKVKPGGCVLVLQNGIGIEEEIASWVPGIFVFGGLCFLCSNKVGPGFIKHLDYGGIRLGNLESNGSQALILLEQIRLAFVTAKIETGIDKNLAQARWQKLMWNMPFNGLSVVLRCTTQQIMEHPAGLRLATQIMEEVEAAANACGSPVPQGFVHKMLENTRRMTPYLPSMRLDYDRGQAMEIDAIYSRPIARAAEHGYDMMHCRMLRDQLLMIQQESLHA